MWSGGATGNSVFQGGLIFVTHETSLLTGVVDCEWSALQKRVGHYGLSGAVDSSKESQVAAQLKQ